MFIVISIMFLGIVLGYVIRKWLFLRNIGESISYTIFMLLFLLGVSVGANKEIVDNLMHLGGQAFLIALAGTFGSVFAAGIVSHYFFKERNPK
ncbi:MAG: lysine exporter LysO family protein [Parabacteroides distasonis]|nr:lysine exporter LysO family protein [Parabacteroides distasonis]MBQ4161379.1 LysO family transporter [Parabacteroides sp.]